MFYSIREHNDTDRLPYCVLATALSMLLDKPYEDTFLYLRLKGVPVVSSHKTNNAQNLLEQINDILPDTIITEHVADNPFTGFLSSRENPHVLFTDSWTAYFNRGVTFTNRPIPQNVLLKYSIEFNTGFFAKRRLIKDIKQTISKKDLNDVVISMS